MNKNNPPSKELCLFMAKFNYEVSKNEKMMWNYLVCWAFYEMYLEGWWQE